VGPVAKHVEASTALSEFVRDAAIDIGQIRAELGGSDAATPGSLTEGDDSACSMQARCACMEQGSSG